MRFRLTYKGPLRANSKGISTHKHEIRRVFHFQLNELWRSDESLACILAMGGLTGRPDALVKRVGNINFIPLVREGWSLHCMLDIIILRKDHPWRVIKTGDIDNRIKTLIDSLKMPGDMRDGSCEQESTEEDPFFVLLEDDKQVSRFSAEADVLLEPRCAGQENEVGVVVAVDVRPYLVTMSTMSFGSS